MKSSKLYLRLVQLLTAIFILGTLFMILILSGVIPKDLFYRDTSKQDTKIQRPKETSSKTVQELVYAGDRASYTGNTDKALEFYQQASQNATRDPVPYEKIGDIHFKNANYEASLQNFRLAYSLSPQNQSYILRSARSLLGMRKIEDANLELDKIDPATPDSFYYKGIIAASLNDSEKAREYLNRSRSGTTDERLINKINAVMSVYQMFDLAQEAPAEYLQTLLAQAMDQNQEYGLAIALAFDALKSEHDYRDTWIILGHAFLNENKWMDAQDALTKAIDLDANHPAPYFFRGIALKKQNKYAEALSDFEKASKMSFKPEIFIKQQMADSHFELNNLNKAFPLYKDVAFGDPSDIRIFVRPMAIAINHLNKPEEALALARKAAEIHPDTAMAENLLGWAAVANNDLSSARDHFYNSIKIDPELAAAYLNLGALNEKEGDINSAMKNYEKAITIAIETGDISIGKTAEIRYTQLQEAPFVPVEVSNSNVIPLNSPKEEKNIPSLSLQ